MAFTGEVAVPRGSAVWLQETTGVPKGKSAQRWQGSPRMELWDLGDAWKGPVSSRKPEDFVIIISSIHNISVCYRQIVFFLRNRTKIKAEQV